MNIEYLTVADVLALHDELLRRYGGAQGIRDAGSLDSAGYRPQCGYYAGLEEEACALLESLLINHPFMDGNKRTAFAACDVFLRINGKVIQAPDTRLYKLMIKWIELDAADRFTAIRQDLFPLIHG